MKLFYTYKVPCYILQGALLHPTRCIATSYKVHCYILQGALLHPTRCIATSYNLHCYINSCLMSAAEVGNTCATSATLEKQRYHVRYFRYRAGVLSSPPHSTPDCQYSCASSASIENISKYSVRLIRHHGVRISQVLQYKHMLYGYV